MDIDKLISDSAFWVTLKVCVKVLLPDVMVLCYSVGMRGGILDLMYNLLLQLDVLYTPHRFRASPTQCEQRSVQDGLVYSSNESLNHHLSDNF